MECTITRPKTTQEKKPVVKNVVAVCTVCKTCGHELFRKWEQEKSGLCVKCKKPFCVYCGEKGKFCSEDCIESDEEYEDFSDEEIQ